MELFSFSVFSQIPEKLSAALSDCVSYSNALSYMCTWGHIYCITAFMHKIALGGFRHTLSMYNLLYHYLFQKNQIWKTIALLLVKY